VAHGLPGHGMNIYNEISKAQKSFLKKGMIKNLANFLLFLHSPTVSPFLINSFLLFKAMKVA
jgi:hypothetical protein